MRALASAVLEPRGRKYLFAPAIIVKSISWLHTFCIAGELTWRTRHAPKLLAAPLGSTPPGSLPDSTWWVGGLQAYPFSKNPTPPQPFELALPCPRNIDCSDATECEVSLGFTSRGLPVYTPCIVDVLLSLWQMCTDFHAQTMQTIERKTQPIMMNSWSGYFKCISRSLLKELLLFLLHGVYLCFHTFTLTWL